LWYISVCSMIGGISVSVTTGLGAAIVTTAMGDNQFTHWFIYFLIAFVAVTLITEVYYLNRALALFNTAMVTPTYYVIFTFCTMVTTVVLFQGLKASALQILTLVMGFLTICAGITILQLSKVDPNSLTKLDRRSTILLQAARQNTEQIGEKNLMSMEDPGVDTIRGSFGTVGSIIRARSAKRMSQSSRMSGARFGNMPPLPYSPSSAAEMGVNHGAIPDTVRRHQLYDTPMPAFGAGRQDSFNGSQSGDSFAMASKTLSPDAASTPRKSTIKFGSEDLVHQYGKNGAATHEYRPPVSPRKSAFTQGLPPLGSPLETPRPGLPGAAPSPGWPRSSEDYLGEGNGSSQWYDEDEESRSRRASEMTSPGRRDKRWSSKPPGERYPRSSGEEEKEESVGLWNGRSNASVSSQDDLLESGEDSIRLVGK